MLAEIFILRLEAIKQEPREFGSKECPRFMPLHADCFICV